MSISIGSWNVNGITHRPDKVDRVFKTEEPEFISYVNKHHIVGLLETQISASEKITINGYVTEQIGRKISTNGRHYGGICIAIKENIAAGVSVLKSNGETEYIWARLDKDFFNISRDLYVGFLYASPEKGAKNFGIEVYDRIAKDIAEYCAKGKCLILGDMNAHTNVNPDFIENDEKGNDLIQLPDSYEADTASKRRNGDKSKVNEHGTSLLELCSDSGLRILNGRKFGDIFGKCTYFGPMCKEPTLIDYGLVHKNDFKDVTMFKVQDLCHLSDHCLIHACVTATVNQNGNDTSCRTRETLSEMPRKFIWEENRRTLFLENLNNPETKFQLRNFLAQTNTIDKLQINNIDSASNAISGIIIGAAEKSLRKAKAPTHRNSKKQYAKHFDIDCKRLLKQVKLMSRKLSKDPKNYHLRKSYYSNKKHLHRLVKQKLASEKENLARSLSSIKSDPKKFWKMLEKLQQCTHGRNNDNNAISADVWIKHFKGLMQSPHNNLEDKHKDITSFVDNKENWTIFNDLSFKINNEEIIKALGNLKNGKACGIDLITNEMLKASSSILLPAFHKLFNLILTSGQYPSAWSNSWLKPLHKGGDQTDPNRYRGISIMSCLGKLFCSILNNRLVSFLEKNNLGNKYQIGFTKDCRTSDHMLAIKTLIDKYNQSNQKLYTCFIDFRKAFDTVWRDALFYKLLKMGIGGPFAEVLKNIYNKSSTQIRLCDGLTAPFHDGIGVKQGCVLSPTLFKIFINDMSDIFDETCRPVKLYNENINCLMFADDAVLLSETREGLQQSLEKIKEYCDNWLLKINSDKTKVMIFNKSGRLLKEKFTLGNEQLENVSSYTYLGLVFVPSGSFNPAMNTLCKKASKAMFKLRRSINKLNLSPKLSLLLYDTLIRPISMYGSEVWGSFIKEKERAFNIECNKYELFDKLCFEKLDLKFCKSILGVHKKSSSTAVRGELGRYPNIIFVLKQVLKNWLRITSYTKSQSVLHDTYLCNLDLDNKRKLCWWSNIKSFFKETLGLPHLVENHGCNGKTKTKIDLAINNMKYIYEFQWRNELNRTMSRNNTGGNKLRTYQTFKGNFEYEKYLDLQVNFAFRKNITKLRISSHKLEIETGRYYSKKNNREKVEMNRRLCKNCNMGEIEDEEHAIMTCPKYELYRKIMLNTLTEASPYFENLNEHEKFIFIMQCQDWEVTDALSKMLVGLQKERGSL